MPDPAMLPRITPLGLDSLLVTFSDVLDDAANRAALAFRARIEREAWGEILETATSLCSALVAFDPARIPHGEMEIRLRTLLDERDWLSADLPEGRRLWTIPVCFEGDHAPHLAEAAEIAGVSPEAAVAELTSTRFRALALGYGPGQAYLGTLPPVWDINRMGTLTPNVPQGAVVLAVRQLVIFTAPTPTGWRQVGQSRFRSFRPENPEAPIAFAPGDEVQLQPISRDALERLNPDDGGATSAVLA